MCRTLGAGLDGPPVVPRRHHRDRRAELLRGPADVNWITPNRHPKKRKRHQSEHNQHPIGPGTKQQSEYNQRPIGAGNKRLWSTPHGARGDVWKLEVSEDWFQRHVEVTVPRLGRKVLHIFEVVLGARRFLRLGRARTAVALGVGMRP